jgi:hypothetical protein
MVIDSCDCFLPIQRAAQTYQMSAFDILTNPAAMADVIGNTRVLPGVQTNDNDGRLIVHGG